MKSLYVQDRITQKQTHREYTPEGFLRVPAYVAKTGVQKYLRRELGLDGDPNEVINVYRPPEEVFSEESLSTYDLADVTFEHPATLVTADTYRKTAVGVIDGVGVKEGDFVKCMLLIKDAETIKKIEQGIAEVSMGYTADYKEQEGVAPCGTPYQYVQGDIRINHCAIVPMARAGRQARIFDNQPKGMTMHKVTLDSGRQVDVQDEAVAILVTDSIQGLQKQLAAKDSDIELKNAEIEALKATVDAQKEKINDLEKETDEGKIKERLKKLSETKDAALKIAPTVSFDSVDQIEIMCTALAAARPSVAWEDKSPSYIEAAFEMALEYAKNKPAATNDAQLQNLAKDCSKQLTQDSGQVMDAYQKSKQEMLKNTREL